MPKYTYPLSNGKSLTLEGDTMPSDAEVEAIAKEQGVSLTPAEGGDMGGDVLLDNVRNMATVGKDLVVGAAKKAGETVTSLGNLARKIPGVSAVDKLMSPAEFSTTPTNTAQKIGGMAEQVGEYALPIAGAEKAAAAVGSKVLSSAPAVVARLAPKVAANAAVSGGVAALHHDDPTTAAMLGGAIPVAGELADAAAQGAKNAGVRLVRAAIKPTVTDMKQTAGASRDGINNVANRVAKFIVDNRLTDAEGAQAIINDAEREIQGMVGGQPTDAATRAGRYLSALERSAGKQGLGADQVAAIRGAAQELVGGPMGQSLPVPFATGHRVLRPTVPADEALESARASSRWQTRRTWGEQGGANTEAAKAVERAQRDAVKTAVPDSRPVFDKYSQAIKGRDVLRRMQFREGNRDVLSLPAQIGTIQEMSQGKPPIISLAANWLRNNQLKAGIWADKLGNAINSNDVKTVGEILGRLGVSTAADAAGPDDMEQELLSRVP